MAMPVSLNVSTSKFSLFAGITLSYLTNVGWWAAAGLLYLAFSYANGWSRVLCLIALGIATIMAVIRTGWTF